MILPGSHRSPECWVAAPERLRYGLEKMSMAPYCET
jgi:hypothetical protein